MQRQSTFVFHHTSHPWSKNKILIWMVSTIFFTGRLLFAALIHIALFFSLSAYSKVEE